MGYSIYLHWIRYPLFIWGMFHPLLRDYVISNVYPSTGRWISIFAHWWIHHMTRKSTIFVLKQIKDLDRFVRFGIDEVTDFTKREYNGISCYIMIYHDISSWYIMLYHIIWCYIMSYHHVISCYIMLYHVISCCIIMLYHVISCYIMLYHDISSCYIMLYFHDCVIALFMPCLCKHADGHPVDLPFLNRSCTTLSSSCPPSWRECGLGVGR